MSVLIPSPSEEQGQFLDAIATDNVVADCVAGSGKTTTVLLIAKQFPHQRILQVTYNSQLKSEVRTKAAAAGLRNLEIHTFHSLALAFYPARGYDDNMIHTVLETGLPPRNRIPPVDILVLDETQDMIPTYFQLVRKFVRDMGMCPRMAILGDRYQGIYGFKGADARFLTLSPDIWGWSDFYSLTLSTSYRVSRPIAAFVNHCMLGYERLRAEREGPPVLYVRCNPFAVHRWLANKIQGLLVTGEYRAEDIFVLANSVKSIGAPVRKLENALVERGIPCYFPASDDRLADDAVLEGKVVFSTFHQSKGRERAVVIIYGFDTTYERCMEDEDAKNRCPETLYVAATRARDRLILLQSNQAPTGPLRFLQSLQSSPFLTLMDLGSGGAERVVEGAISRVVMEDGDTVHKETVTGLTRFLKEGALYALSAIVGEVFVEEAADAYSVGIPGKVASAVGCEDVSDINGLVIPAMYESRHCSPERVMSTIEVDVRNIMAEGDAGAFLTAACASLPSPAVSVEDFLRTGVLYNACVERLYNRVSQITAYDWLTEEAVEACFVALKPHLRSDTIFEQAVDATVRTGEFGIVELSGRLDALNEDCVWEIKCVETLVVEHYVQVLLYAWIWRQEYVEQFGAKEFRIVNIRTGQIQRLQQNAWHLVEEAVHIVFGNKWHRAPALTDEEFKAACAVEVVKSVSVPKTKKSATGFLGDE